MVLMRFKWQYVYERRLRVFCYDFHSDLPPGVYINVQLLDSTNDPLHCIDGLVLGLLRLLWTTSTFLLSLSFSKTLRWYKLFPDWGYNWDTHCVCVSVSSIVESGMQSRACAKKCFLVSLERNWPSLFIAYFVSFRLGFSTGLICKSTCIVLIICT